jgi:hypothetical protein
MCELALLVLRCKLKMLAILNWSNWSLIVTWVSFCACCTFLITYKFLFMCGGGLIVG